MIVHMHPEPGELVHMVKALMNESRWNWTNILVVYESPEGK